MRSLEPGRRPSFLDARSWFVRFGGRARATSRPFVRWHKVNMTPVERMPKTNLDGALGNELANAYWNYFVGLRYSTISPRDLMLRTAKTKRRCRCSPDVKEEVDNARLPAWSKTRTCRKTLRVGPPTLQKLSVLALRPGFLGPRRRPGQAEPPKTFAMPPGIETSSGLSCLATHRSHLEPRGDLFDGIVRSRACRTEIKRPNSGRTRPSGGKRLSRRFGPSPGPIPGARAACTSQLLARCQQFSGK